MKVEVVEDPEWKGDPGCPIVMTFESDKGLKIEIGGMPKAECNSIVHIYGRRLSLTTEVIRVWIG